MDHVSLFANTIASKALVTLIAAKKAIRAASNSTLHQGLDYEKNVFTPLVSSKAAKVGVNAFLTKTKPDFSKH